MMENTLSQLFQEILVDLAKAWQGLHYSFEKCQRIGIKSQYSFDELESLEALTARFSRLYDLLTQKVLRMIDEIELENEGSFLDRLNRAEKRKLIDSVEVFRDMKKLRNMITHEYETERLLELYQDTLQYVPVLEETIQRIQKYSQNFAG